MIAGEQAAGPQADAADLPEPVVLVGVLADALVLETVLELAEIDPEVARGVGAGVAGEADRPVRMRPFEMHRVDRIFLALEPVARDLGEHDLAEAVRPGEELPIRHQRTRLRAEIGPEQPAPLLDRVGFDADFVAQPPLRVRHVLVGLRQAGAVGIVEPAVIVAAQPAFFDIAVAEIGAAMPAMAVEKPEPAAEILVEDEVLAEQAHRPDAGLGELAGAGDRPPVAAQQLAHRGARAGLRQHVPAASRFGSSSAMIGFLMRRRRSFRAVFSVSPPRCRPARQCARQGPGAGSWLFLDGEAPQPETPSVRQACLHCGEACFERSEARFQSGDALLQIAQLRIHRQQPGADQIERYGPSASAIAVSLHLSHQGRFGRAPANRSSRRSATRGLTKCLTSPPSAPISLTKRDEMNW